VHLPALSTPSTATVQSAVVGLGLYTHSPLAATQVPSSSRHWLPPLLSQVRDTSVQVPVAAEPSSTHSQERQRLRGSDKAPHSVDKSALPRVQVSEEHAKEHNWCQLVTGRVVGLKHALRLAVSTWNRTHYSTLCSRVVRHGAYREHQMRASCDIQAHRAKLHMHYQKSARCAVNCSKRCTGEHVGRNIRYSTLLPITLIRPPYLLLSLTLSCCEGEAACQGCHEQPVAPCCV
jgi:hypothetical protein